METDVIIQGNCIDALKTFPENSVDLVFADPPFNIGYDYDGQYQDTRDDPDYLSWCAEWIGLCHRVLKPSGSFFLAIGDEYAAELKICATRELEDPFVLRNWIIWHYRFGQNSRTKFSRSHAHIFYFAKDHKQSKFNADMVSIMSARQKNYADKRAFSRLGKVPDDVWNEFPRVCGTFEERHKDFPCQMPESLLARIIRATTDPGDVVVDPFSGSGTTVAVAKKLDRRYIGIELSRPFARHVEERLLAIDSQTQTQELFLQELNSLYLESGVPLDRLTDNEYLCALFHKQLSVRLGCAVNDTPDELIEQLKALRKKGKLSKTLTLDEGRSYRNISDITTHENSGQDSPIRGQDKSLWT